MIICCLSAASGAAASLANATRLDVCSWLPAQSRASACKRSQAGCVGESAMHPCSAAPSPPRMCRSSRARSQNQIFRCLRKPQSCRGGCCRGNCSFQAGRWRSSSLCGCNLTQVSLSSNLMILSEQMWSLIVFLFFIPFIYSLFILV